MLLIIPVSQEDYQLSDDIIRVITKLGGCKKHSLLTVARPSINIAAFKIAHALKDSFLSTECHIFNTNGMPGWPQGPNFYFQETIRHLKSIENQLPWLWMELDATPLKSGWLDCIEKEYEESKKNF